MAYHTGKKAEVVRAVRSGQSKPSAAKVFDYSEATVRKILREEDFCDANPIHKEMGALEIDAASFLWSRGYTVSKKKGKD